MKIIDWNISYNNAPEPKVDFLKSVIGDDSFIAILQEVTPSQYDVIKADFCNVRYSLDYRKPGKFDTGQRELGVAVICSNNIVIKDANVLERCLLPDRTLMVDVEYKGSMLRVMGLHSITGIAHKKAKSMQFFSWAEAVDGFKPDVVAFDANEPMRDHYDIEKMEFFNNLDNGYGAKAFFTTLQDTGLRDAYADDYDPDKYIEGEPLALSHILEKTRANRRYDFIFMDKNIVISECRYLFDEAIVAGGDHSLIRVSLNE